MHILLAPAICVIGAIMFFAAKNNAEVKEAGRIMFAFGLLVSLLIFGAGKAVNLP